MTPRGLGDAWVGNELGVVTREGLPFALHALVHSKPTYFLSPEILELDRRTRGIYPLPPLRFALSLALAPWLFGRRFFAALGNAIAGDRESLETRLKGLWHLALACHWARGLGKDPVTRIHAQWAHASGTVAMYGAWLLDVPFSFTGHAADLFRDRAALGDKIRRAEFIVCISSFHERFYLEQGARPEQLETAYCGIDTDRFRPGQRAQKSDEPLRILSSGRLVEKKGFATLIDACGILKERGVPFECIIAGSGELEDALRDRVECSGLSDCVQITGEILTQEELPEFMRGGDLYCLPCVQASDGDIDGLPQMLMEAMACGLPVVSTRLVGIPDLVIDGVCGLLVESDRPSEVADACERLMRDPALSAKLASAGRERILACFDLQNCLEPLIERFRSTTRAQ